jgi:hypothetical protein
LKKEWLKPSSTVTIAFKVTVYEDYVLRLLAAKCNTSKSALVRAALLRLLVGVIVENSWVRGELPPGYDSMLRRLSKDVEEVLDKCIDKLR